ncbi:hypothetical protein [Streptomyces phaeochromogenes]
MTESSREVTRAVLDQLLADVDAGAWRLGKTRADVLEAATISLHTAIEESRVLELLAGATPEAPPHDKDAREEFFKSLIKQRLALVRKHAAQESGGRSPSLRRIADDVQISHSQIDHLLKGRLSARVHEIDTLERHFRVPKGFLSMPEGEALAAYLQDLVEKALPAAAIRAGIEAMGVTQVALRHTGDGTPDLRDLVPIFDALAARERVQGREEQGQPRQP